MSAICSTRGVPFDPKAAAKDRKRQVSAQLTEMRREAERERKRSSRDRKNRKRHQHQEEVAWEQHEQWLRQRGVA